MRRDIDFSAIFPVDRGFTLVEMIISIVITGIVVSMVAIFGRNQINAYIDVGNRAELSDAADTALRRIARDLQSALPNSVRNASAGLPCPSCAMPTRPDKRPSGNAGCNAQSSAGRARVASSGAT